MHTYTLAHLSSETLLADLAGLVATDRRTTAALLAHIAEVDARELFVPAAYPSMHAYCTGALHMAEEVAYKRIRAARTARRFPQIFEAIADGRLHVTGVGLLGPHLRDDNVDEVLAAAVHRSKVEIEMLVVRLAPKPDLPTAITPIVPASPAEPALRLDPDPIPAPAEAPPARVKPLAPERFALQVTISQETRAKLERAQALMRHRNPSGDLAEVIDSALDRLLASLEKQKFGATSRPRARGARTEEADPAYVSRDVRRQVHERDGEQCTFVSADGVRCTERGFLEFDHRTPKSRGGLPTVGGTRLLCRVHNQYEAERILGADFMCAKRESARSARAHAMPAPTAVAHAHAEIGADNMVRANAEVALATVDPEVTVTTPPQVAREVMVTASPAVDPQLAATAPPYAEADVVLALRGLGFKADEVRRAMSSTALLPATTFEQRLRAALAELTRSRGSRCSDGPFELAWERTRRFRERLARFPQSVQS